MALFSERYGYTKVSDVIIRETITTDIQNSLCNCFDLLERVYRKCGYNILDNPIISINKEVWTYYFNKRSSEFRIGRDIIIEYIQNPAVKWYEVLDIVEFVIKYMHERDAKVAYKHSPVDLFAALLNQEFERLHFAYRIVNCEIVEITSEHEIKAIESAIANSQHNVKMHLNSALEKYALRPNGDYRNSIKESISAVEAFCREKTGESTLGKALSKLEKKNIIIPKSLKSAFDKLYEYTNHADTGIRHALMADEGKYTPSADEALFMLISCSAFINYLSKKVNY